MDILITQILFYGSALVFSVFLAFCIILISITEAYPVIDRSKKEKYFIDPKSGKSELFPNLSQEFSLNLTVVVPAYNEENRIKPMLEECVEFLEKRATSTDFKYEIIVVSDGSKDSTVQIASEYSKQLTTDKLRVLELEKNRGKGGAVRLGIQNARGALILFADADGATKFPDLQKLEHSLLTITEVDYMKNPEKICNELAISIGSRAHLEQEAVASRSLFRSILMYGFHFLVWLFAVRGLKDTQCGFKLFTRQAARVCFESIHVESWAFDVELLYVAQKLKIPIAEVAVNWTEIDGSKLTPIWSWIQMGKDLGFIWLRYMIGAWKIKATKKD